MTIVKKQCAEWGDSIKRAADSFYEHQITETKNLIEQDIASGTNPDRHPAGDGIVTIDLHILLARTQSAKQDAYSTADAKATACDTEAVPDFLADAQKVTDFAMAVALVPYALLVQDYAAASHVDLGEIYKGKTFGGNDALIPKFRDDALNALGIGGTAADVIRDPGKAAGAVVAGAAEATGEAVGEVISALGNVVNPGNWRL